MAGERNFMSKEEFCGYVKAKVLDYLPDEYKDANIELPKVFKQNRGELTALVLRKQDSIIAPSVYLDDYYEEYRNGVFLNDIVLNIAKERMRCESYTFAMDRQEIENLINFPFIKEKIYVEAISVADNEELLSRVPHTVMGDIAASYCIEIKKEEEGSRSIRITNDMMKHYGVSKETLHQVAVTNSVKQRPVDFLKMDDLLNEIMGSGFYGHSPLYVLSNEQKLDGASVIFYPGVLDRVAAEFPEGFYAIPSSKHELIILSKEIQELDEVSQMLRDINDTVVAAEDILSYRVHEYDSASKQLYIAGEEPPVMEVNRKRGKVL